MKGKRIAGFSDPATLTQPGKRKGLRHRNRIKSKREQKLIQMNPGFEFYFDERDVCCYRKKADE